MPKSKAATKQSSKTTVSTKKAAKRNSSANEHFFMSSIIDILELNKIKFEPQENWRLVSEPHKLNEPFHTGLLGKTGYSLLEVISRVYSRKLDELPPIKKMDRKTKKEYLLPFWGTAIFLNSINIDSENKIVELDFDSSQ
jgi:hypothetical protein